LEKIVLDDQRVHCRCRGTTRPRATGNGARNWSGAGSDAVAATVIVYSMRASVGERLHDLRQRWNASGHGDIDAVGASPFVGAGVDGLLVDDGVYAKAVLPVCGSPYDQLALAAADRDQAVDSLRPVCTGSCTDCANVPGAFTSTRRRSATFVDRRDRRSELPRGIDDAAEQALATARPTMERVR